MKNLNLLLICLIISSVYSWTRALSKTRSRSALLSSGALSQRSSSLSRREFDLQTKVNPYEDDYEDQFESEALSFFSSFQNSGQLSTSMTIQITDLSDEEDGCGCGQHDFGVHPAFLPFPPFMSPFGPFGPQFGELFQTVVIGVPGAAFNLSALFSDEAVIPPQPESRSSQIDEGSLLLSDSPSNDESGDLFEVVHDIDQQDVLRLSTKQNEKRNERFNFKKKTAPQKNNDKRVKKNIFSMLVDFDASDQPDSQNVFQMENEEQEDLFSQFQRLTQRKIQKNVKRSGEEVEQSVKPRLLENTKNMNEERNKEERRVQSKNKQKEEKETKRDTNNEEMEMIEEEREKPQPSRQYVNAATEKKKRMKFLDQLITDEGYWSDYLDDDQDAFYEEKPNTISVEDIAELLHGRKQNDKNKRNDWISKDEREELISSLLEKRDKTLRKSRRLASTYSFPKSKSGYKRYNYPSSRQGRTLRMETKARWRNDNPFLNHDELFGLADSLPSFGLAGDEFDQLHLRGIRKPFNGKKRSLRRTINSDLQDLFDQYDDDSDLEDDQDHWYDYSQWRF